MGEFHFSNDWKTLFFHSDREGGSGNYDIWVTHLVRGEWSQPENVREVNSDAHDSRPFVTQDGSELWGGRLPPLSKLRSIRRQY